MDPQTSLLVLWTILPYSLHCFGTEYVLNCEISVLSHQKNCSNKQRNIVLNVSRRKKLLQFKGSHSIIIAASAFAVASTWGSIILTCTHKFDKIDISIREQGMFKKPVEIGNEVWIGTEVIIQPGVTIGDKAKISSGAFVTKNIPKYAVAGSIPAKIIRFRNKE